METLLFKTDVHSADLMSKLWNSLRNIDGIVNWKLDLESIYNLLIIKGRSLSHLEIIKELEQIGIKAIRLYEE